jgi:dienelactone hydrolase
VRIIRRGLFTHEPIASIEKELQSSSIQQSAISAIGRVIWLSICLLPGLLFCACATLGGANDPEELARTVRGGFIAIPATHAAVEAPVFGPVSLHADEAAKMPSTAQMPLVIYLHGCSGIGRLDQAIIRFLFENDYAVLAPNRFAREYNPKSCDPQRHSAGLLWGVLQYRLAEARYAVDVAKTFPWVDERHIFILGFSEGGVAAAKYGDGGLAGRIILSWTCHDGWSENHGLAGPKDEPVLSIVADKDPWYTGLLNGGDCGEWMRDRKNSESIVVKVNAPTHHVLQLPGVPEKILEFLDACRRGSRD